MPRLLQYQPKSHDSAATTGNLFVDDEVKNLKEYIVTTENLPTIYCDLDETLVDFFDGADRTLKKFGYPEWRDKFWKEFINEEADVLRWSIITKQSKFWKNLKWLRDGHKLWEFIAPYNPHICSHATEHMPTCYPEKIQWIKENLGINTDERIHVVRNRGDKKLFAQSNGKPNLLIDDYEKNCNEFIAAGGLAILHTSAANTISELKKLGFK